MASASVRARVVTITVSDTRTAENDHSGKALAEELAAFDLLRHERVPDAADRIVATVRQALADADAVVVSGGTGIAPRDVTYEALSPLLEKRLDGFGEAFRRLSWDEIGPRAIMSRAVAGVVGSGLVFVLPGSTNAARLGARALVAPILGHAVDLLHGRTKHGAG
jgi:molybdenum cofactor biosynthesis protein B